ncbi:MAG TPA: hypothetical protein PKJ86_00220 [Candidatus Dojkabacteria bacterium]|nr:hypothetical protein [Candidatus Dojkabacteria bacterium]
MVSKVLNKTPEEIVDDICKAYTNSQGIFIEKTNAEDYVPDADKTVQIQFLFWIIQMDYATKSSKLYENANRLYKTNTEWLNPNFFLNMPNAVLLDFVRKNFKPRYANEIVKRFKVNAKLLNEDYSGKAINIISSSNSALELLSRIKRFRGFGDKLANFLVRTYIDLLKLSYTDIDQVLQPVDIHDVRLTFEWGFIDSMKMTQQNIKFVKELWSEACKKTRWSWITFDKALWLIGSKGQRTDDYISDYQTNLGL